MTLERNPYALRYPLFSKTSKEALWQMVVDLLAEQTGHADDATTEEVLAAFIERHEVLFSAGWIETRLPGRIRDGVGA